MANIEIGSPHIDPLIALFTKEEQEADKLIREAYSKKYAAMEMLKQLNKLKNDIVYVSNRFNISNSFAMQTHEYDSNFIWLKKIKFVLEKYGPLTLDKIVDTIVNEYGPDLNRKLTEESVSGILNAKNIEGKDFLKTVNADNENVYMLNPVTDNVSLK